MVLNLPTSKHASARIRATVSKFLRGRHNPFPNVRAYEVRVIEDVGNSAA